MMEVLSTLATFISPEEQVWLAVMWCMVMMFPYLFYKTAERAADYCYQHHARITTRGISVIAVLYLAAFVAYITAYMIKFRVVGTILDMFM